MSQLSGSMSNLVSTTIEKNFSLMAQGKYQEVHAFALSLIQKNVNDPVPYLLLAKLCFDHKNFKKSGELFDKAVTLAPDNVYVLTFYAQSLTFLGNHVSAKIFADKAAGVNPEQAYVLDTLGVIYSRLGFHEEAIHWFEKAVAIDSEVANYHYNLAASQQFLGNFDAAHRSYEESLKRLPDDYRALSSLVSLKKQQQNENRLGDLLRVFAKLEDDEDATLYLGHALAKTYEDMGEYAESFKWLQKAKAAKSKKPTSVDYKKIFAAAKSSIEPQPTNVDQNAKAPIFVVGLPRTGTTLVDRIISSHRDVTSGGELNTFAELVKRATNSTSQYVLDESTLLQANDLTLNNVGHDYIQATNALYRNAERCTDKMPLNFFYAGLIHKVLPNARIIALRRGAMDSCLSNYRQLLTTQHAYYDYTYDIESTAAFYKMFDDLMCHWRNTLPADRFLEVNYEDIVYHQEKKTREILTFCDLDWDEACMRFHENDAPVSTASSVQVRQPLYSGSIGRWKKYGSLLDDLQYALGELHQQGAIT